MRVIGHLNSEKAAKKFSDFLYVRKIENQVEADTDSTWMVWVHDDDDLAQASELLAAFQANPDDTRFQEEAKAAAVLRQKQEEDLKAYRKKIHSGRETFTPLASLKLRPITAIFMAISVVVYVYGSFNPMEDRRLRDLFYLTDQAFHGQIWRFLTPVFLHGSLLHILFNMLWLHDLGKAIEGRKSSIYFLLMIVVFGVVSNLCQAMVFGPRFGGMSGVVYGLLGYIWMKTKFDIMDGLALSQSTVTMMLIWLALGFTPVLPGIANGAHVGGLVIGMIWGFIASHLRRGK